jgi:UDP-N-acetylglucosamine 1-carboxyvinyltransferase
MDALRIEGPSKLSGTVKVSGSKNTALPLLFAALLFDREVSYENVPRLWDIETTLKILETMGAKTHWDKEAGKISILPTIETKVAPYEWVRKMRAGILALGPLVAKYGEAKVSLPGGCAIGARPVNFHLDVLRKMGVNVTVEEGYVKAQLLGQLKGAHIVFPQVTVTGTENALFWAARAEGKTIIENAASEPEVVALGEFLQTVGVKITGLGTSRVEIVGGPIQHPQKPIRIPPDRIETGTWISVAVATRSALTIADGVPHQLGSVIEAYREMGVGIDVSDEGTIRVTPNDSYRPLDVETSPFPGFPTDMQAQLLVTLCLAAGTSKVEENIFENRFMHVAELRRLGANILVHGNLALVEGPTVFQGAPIMATDLRASASLVIAGLCAKGTTDISRIYHLDRGYQRLDLKLQELGARITRVAE